MNTLQLTLDSSEIATYCECPRKWYYQYKLSRRKFGKRAALNRGSLLHAFLEAYYREPTRAHANKLLEWILEAKHEAKFQTDLLEVGGNLSVISLLKSEYGLQLEETKYELDEKDFDLVLRRSNEYCGYYGDQDLEVVSVNGKPGIELGFAKKIGEFGTTVGGESTIVEFILDGRMDLLVRNRQLDLIGWLDHKTESAKRDLYGRRIQFRNYDLALNMGSSTQGMGIINYVGMQQKPTPDTFRRKTHFFSAKSRENWQKWLIERVYLEILEKSLKAESSPNFFACETKYGLCEFVDVCEHDTDAGRKFEIENQYIQVDPWRPWK